MAPDSARQWSRWSCHTIPARMIVPRPCPTGISQTCTSAGGRTTPRIWAQWKAPYTRCCARPAITRAEFFRSCHLGGAEPVEIHPAGTFDARQDVVNRLRADPHELTADDLRHEVRGNIENLLGRRAIESLAQDRRHRFCERLHLRSERHTKMGMPLAGIDLHEH